MNRNNKKMTTSFIILSLFLIGLVYAILQANLQINGTAKIQANTWDIHFDNIQVNANSVAIGTGDSAATIDPENNCKVDFEVTLSIPGDFYEFTIDVVNAGTIDGMIGELNKTLKVNNEVVQETPDYLDYSVTYADGMEILENHIIVAGYTKKIKVRLEFKTDIDELPSATTFETSLSQQFVQADRSSIYYREVDFANDSWSDIINAYKVGNIKMLEQTMKAGTTREVQLDIDNDGTPEAAANVRIANLSTPSDCTTTGFSQTACGFVIEFSNIIATHLMNSTNEGGWPTSSMRTYVNTDIYNALPSDLKSIIIETTVVSGHGSTTGEENFTSTDKLYLLDAKEIFGISFDSYNDSRYHTAKDLERQLDYYVALNVTISSNTSLTIKNYFRGRNESWFLRSAYSKNTSQFFYVPHYGGCALSNASYTNGVSPAFRIAE